MWKTNIVVYILSVFALFNPDLVDIADSGQAVSEVPVPLADWVAWWFILQWFTRCVLQIIIATSTKAHYLKMYFYPEDTYITAFVQNHLTKVTQFSFDWLTL